MNLRTHVYFVMYYPAAQVLFTDEPYLLKREERDSGLT
jgi:hypothetical protein